MRVVNKKWLIKKKSAIGQQIETVWDKDRFVEQKHYSHGEFSATRIEANRLLEELKSRGRMYKWIRLYEVC